MSKYLCTFSGKYGDILWSLATARFIAEHVVSAPVDFAVMPYYENLCPLLAAQSYIDRAFIIPDWLRTHSNHGDQPWQPPVAVEQQYEKFWHLTYRGHPGISAPSMPLVDFTAYQQGIKLEHPMTPFLEASYDAKIPIIQSRMLQELDKPLVVYSFNDQYKELKDKFLQVLWMKASQEYSFVDLSSWDWLSAAVAIDSAMIFVGCRSAAWVLASGMGKDTITYEPHPSRHKLGHLGGVFSYPSGQEATTPYGLPPEPSAEVAYSWIQEKAKRMKEQKDAQNALANSAVGAGGDSGEGNHPSDA